MKKSVCFSSQSIGLHCNKKNELENVNEKALEDEHQNTL